MSAKDESWLTTPTPASACAIIAEVGQNHDGSLGLAHAHIDAAANAGADAIKFQTHIADEESSPLEPWRTTFSSQDATRMDYWRRMEFTEHQWQELKQHADDAGIHFLSSPFSVKAVHLLEKLGVSAWKIASGEINNLPLLDSVIVTDKPIILSTGLSDLEEITSAFNYVKRNNNPLALLQCTSQYPSSAERIGINVIDEFRGKFGCAVGLSDHSGSIYSGLAAATLNIQILEVHITLSREMFGPDVAASVTTDELKTLIKGVRQIETMITNPVDKSTIHPDAMELRKIFMKSLYTTRDINKGEKLTDNDLTTKKPGTGIPASKINDIVGKKTNKNIEANSMIQLGDLE